MINGLDIFYTKVNKGDSLKIVENKGDGLKLVKGKGSYITKLLFQSFFLLFFIIILLILLNGKTKTK